MAGRPDAKLLETLRAQKARSEAFVETLKADPTGYDTLGLIRATRSLIEELRGAIEELEGACR